MTKPQLNIVMVGHVDHGKSTLIGRLIYELNALPDGKYEQIHSSCTRRNMAFEWAYLMDALQAERSQNITIDISQFWLRTPNADYVLIDAPGHHEFLRNMFTGAAESDCAILLIDAAQGLEEQTRKHAYLLHLLGLKHIIIVINKMDKVEYSEQIFNELKEQAAKYCAEIQLNPTHIIPISAYNGELLTAISNNMKWYDGVTLVHAMQNLAENKHNTIDYVNLRFTVQDVYRFDERRIIAGMVVNGEIRVGDNILISPHNYQAEIASIITADSKSAGAAVAGQAIGITLKQQRFVERGHVISHVSNPPKLTNRLYMRLFWLSPQPLNLNQSYKLRLHNSSLNCEIAAINYVLDTVDLQKHQNQGVMQHQVAEVLINVRGLAVIDEYNENPNLGRAVLEVDGRIVAGGLVMLRDLPNMRSAPKIIASNDLSLENMQITSEQRTALNRHTGGILWFTGLSGAGKSTLAQELQQQLFMRGYQVYVLDGDNVRQGLNADLGFTPKDRTENIRRVGEVAALFADAGMIVMAAFISPYGEDRKRARAASPEKFHTVYIKAGVDACEMRDVKGLYKKARSGEINDFTGISAPYEVPESPELIINTETMNINDCTDLLIKYVQKHFGAR
jgi:bifunctional enzyme CysN/CysC